MREFDTSVRPTGIRPYFLVGAQKGPPYVYHFVLANTGPQRTPIADEILKHFLSLPGDQVISHVDINSFFSRYFPNQKIRFSVIIDGLTVVVFDYFQTAESRVFLARLGNPSLLAQALNGEELIIRYPQGFSSFFLRRELEQRSSQALGRQFQSVYVNGVLNLPKDILKIYADYLPFSEPDKAAYVRFVRDLKKALSEPDECSDSLRVF